MTELDAVVTMEGGAIRGELREAVYSFKGVRYGQPTGGMHRFRAPRPVPIWSGILSATEYGAIPYQGRQTDRVYQAVFDGMYTRVINGGPTDREMSEDCLNLNIWTRELDRNRKAPVIVWLHPGAFLAFAADADWNEGDHLARDQNVVVVSVNHRVNIFGFCDLHEFRGPSFADSGNAGMLDIVLALEWVRDNIDRFGGDPGNVTIFGDAGGGWKVSTLLAMPCAQGLFHRAIIQSSALTFATPPAQAREDTLRVFSRAGLDPSCEHGQALPPQKLLSALEAEWTFPVIGASLPQQPYAASRDPRIPLLIGFSKDEWIYPLVSERPPDLTTAEGAIAFLATRMRRFGVDEEVARLAWGKVSGLQAGLSPLDTYARCYQAIYCDEVYIEAENACVRGNTDVYFYKFDWQSEEFGGSYGSCHTFCIPFVFGTLEAAPQIVGRSPSAKVRALSHRMARAWAQFARTGDPNHSDLPFWPAYDVVGRQVMQFDYECRVRADPDEQLRNAIASIRQLRLAKRRPR
jgi:para-nitrobenzyl esterase